MASNLLYRRESRFRYGKVTFILPSGITQEEISIRHSIVGMHLSRNCRCEKGTCANFANFTVAGDYGYIEICLECLNAIEKNTGKRIVWREVDCLFM